MIDGLTPAQARYLLRMHISGSAGWSGRCPLDALIRKGFLDAEVRVTGAGRAWCDRNHQAVSL